MHEGGFHATYTTVSEVDDNRYVQFHVPKYQKKLPFRFSGDEKPASGITEKAIDTSAYAYLDDDDDGYINPDAGYDELMHGLADERKGDIAVYGDWGRDELYSFEIIPGPEGINDLHRSLGRVCGTDIPEFVVRDTNPGSGQHTPGEITEAIAYMRLLAPDVSNFSIAQHDLGYLNFSHGPSWSHTHPRVYDHLSRTAQGIIEEYGERVHDRDDNDRKGMLPEAIRVARALDRQINRLQPTIRNFSIMEHRIRKGNYDDMTDLEAGYPHLVSSFKRCSYDQVDMPRGLMVELGDDSESTRYRTGYWIGMQLVSGVLQTRLALHEVQPHPEATDAQTSRTLGLLGRIKTEVDRRLEENRAYTL